MQEIIQHVGSFLLGAVPTMILFVVLVIAYQILVQGPLTATLNERRARTTGAIEDAQKPLKKPKPAPPSTISNCVRPAPRFTRPASSP